MRKYLIGALAGAALMVSVQVMAEDGLQKIEAYLRPGLPITLDGQKVTFESSPVMVDGSTYLKLRDVATITGLGVEWNDTTQTVEMSTTPKVDSKNENTTKDESEVTRESPEFVAFVNSREHHVVYDRDKNVAFYYMTDNDYDLYKRIKQKDMQLTFCNSVEKSAADLLLQLTTEEMLRLRFDFIYNQSVVMTFRDLGINTENQDLNLRTP
ncbi:stalk domain-containing protein [Paenibacillus cymbidii]|uniref:stalk domain-containing protein n=1 Tax=Paenibacillus cymbidii TaxID=1639034 RepID=UPI001436C1CD|nr:stalk domain-containing protein [Paenibacillus cymbidii]